MGRNTTGTNGASEPDERSDLESTARTSSRASRPSHRGRLGRSLRARSGSAEAAPVSREIPSPPPTAAGLSGGSAPRSAFGVEDDWRDADDAMDEPEDEARGALLRWIMVTTLLAVTVLSLVGVAIYLTDVVDQWEERADELTDVNYRLGEQVASQAETIDAQTEQIDILTDQLGTAQDSISDLASQRANSDDDLAYAQQRIEILSGYASTGAAVANALTRCLDGSQQLVVYLDNPDDYDEDEVAAYAESVDELCTAARKANSDFQALLAE